MRALITIGNNTHPPYKMYVNTWRVISPLSRDRSHIFAVLRNFETYFFCSLLVDWFCWVYERGQDGFLALIPIIGSNTCSPYKMLCVKTWRVISPLSRDSRSRIFEVLRKFDTHFFGLSLVDWFRWVDGAAEMVSYYYDLFDENSVNTYHCYHLPRAVNVHCYSRR